MSGTVLRAAETSGNKTKDSVSIATYIQGEVEKKKHIKGQVMARAQGVPNRQEGLCFPLPRGRERGSRRPLG